MTFEEELRRVVDQLAEHLRHEAAGRLQAAMPELYDASQSEQKAAITEAIGRARDDAERDFNERIETVKREASEQVAAAKQEAADRVAASERQAAEQLEAARREHAERVETLQRETSEQLQAKDREAAEALETRSREAAERLEIREREITELLEAKNREVAARLEVLEREAIERAESASREAAERLEQVESTAAHRLVTATSEAEGRARDAGRAEGRREGKDVLAEGIASLGRARSLSEVLDRLTDAASREVPFVAVLLAHGDHAKAWRVTRFGQRAGEADAITVALAEAGVIREAIQDGRIVRSSSTNAGDVPRFAASHSEERRALAAFPVIVGGSTVAVVYGDGPEETSASWQSSLEALTSCASRLLETITAFRTASLLAGS